jgi:glycosyltransferase involved in cell wall biosynthesis
MAFRQLIVGGWPASSAHQLAFVLNEHPALLIGVERYSKVRPHIDQYHLHPRRILDPLPQETDVRADALYRRLAPRADSPGLAYAGDAGGGYALIAGELAERILTARVIVALGPPPRDGRQAAQWVAVAKRIRATESQSTVGRVFMLPWEGGDESLAALLSYLRLPGSPRLSAEWARRDGVPARADDPEDPEVASLERWRRDRGQAVLERWLVDEEPLPADEDPPLTSAEIDDRAMERAAVREPLRGAIAEWPDELETLRRRQEDDARELRGRGERLRQARATSLRGYPDRRFRVVMVNPFDRTDLFAQSGVDDLAAALARIVHVRLLVPPGHFVLPGEAEVLELDSSVTDELRDVDAWIVPPGVGHMPRGDVRVVWLLTKPEDLNLIKSDPREVITFSRWLTRMARQAGVPAVHIPFGLYRGLLRGQPRADRPIAVSALARTGQAHGVEDLEAALVTVRTARPDVEVMAMGGVPIDGATIFRFEPLLFPMIGGMCASAVHVVAAHTGGAEVTSVAQAAGCAVVATATADVTEVVMPGRTAVLAPIGDVDGLASAVIDLLDDATRRERIANEGGRDARRLLASWPESARRLVLALNGPR